MEEEIGKSLEQLIVKLTKLTESKMRTILANKGKSQSRLMKTVRLRVETTKTGYVVTNSMPDYAIFVDKGRKPGKQPPLKAIIEWCKRKNIDKGLAYPIARAIGKRGIKPTGFMNPLYDLRIALLNNIGKTLTQQFMNIIKTIKKESKNIS